MGGMFSPQQSMAPTAIPGFEFAAPQLQQLGTLGLQGIRPGAFQGGLSGMEQEFLSQLAPSSGNSLAALFGQGANMLGGAGNMNFQDMVGQISGMLRPSMVDRPFQQGAAQLREQGALTGNLSSTGTTSAITDLLGQLEGQFAGQLPGAVANIALPMQQNRMNAGSGLLQTALGGLGQLGGMERGVGQQNFQNTLQRLGMIGNMQQGLGSGVAGTQQGFFQPTEGPSKFERIGTAGMGAAGMAMGAKCWVARAAFGSWEHPMVWRTRVWLCLQAPRPVYRAYVSHGPRIGRIVARSRVLKALTRAALRIVTH